MTKIFEASELPENEKVYLRKDFLGWRVVHPKLNEDGTINKAKTLLSFGGLRSLLFTIVFIIIVLAIFVLVKSQYAEIEESYTAIIKNPLSYCEAVYKGDAPVQQGSISFINISVKEGSSIDG